MNLKAYPLRTEPFLRDYLWGGRKLETKLGKTLPPQGIWAESWEIIDHPEHQSVVTNGTLAGKTLHELALAAPEWLLGADRANGANPPQGGPAPSIPLLLKYLDCQRVLSVQVHPDDAYGQKMNPPDLGKTEAWYIIDAEPSGVLYAGLKQGVTRDRLKLAIEQGSLEACLHEIRPQAGDCVFIPAGTVHALGAGLLVAEIQQASNTTFRLFDWNRVGGDGQPRQLHVEQALDVIDFDRGPCELQVPRETEQVGRTRLLHCEKFVFDRLAGEELLRVAGDQKFHFLTAPFGGVVLHEKGDPPATWEPTRLDPGDSVFLPAAMDSIEVRMSREAVLLDMYLP